MNEFIFFPLMFFVKSWQFHFILIQIFFPEWSNYNYNFLRWYVRKRTKGSHYHDCLWLSILSVLIVLGKEGVLIKQSRTITARTSIIHLNRNAIKLHLIYCGAIFPWHILLIKYSFKESNYFVTSSNIIKNSMLSFWVNRSLLFWN